VSKGHWREKTTRDGQKAATLQQFHAVYVYGPLEGSPAKIGIAENPNKRCQGLQTGFWKPAKIWRYWWTLGRVMAFKLEQQILADNQARRLVGEWLDISAEDLMAQVVPAAERHKIRIFDDQEATRLAFAFSRRAEINAFEHRRGITRNRIEDRKHL
jgi:hypothetical protein